LPLLPLYDDVVGRLIVMGRLCEFPFLFLVDSTWDTFFTGYVFYTVARVVWSRSSSMYQIPMLPGSLVWL
jgi:hypothetical protein